MSKGEEQLRSFLLDVAANEKYVLCDIDIKPLNSGGANYTTDLYLATISQPQKPDINIFAKAAILTKDARESNGLLARVYQTEAHFYSEIAVNFERLYNKNKVPLEDRLIIPKYYGHILAPFEELLVMENLEIKGFKCSDRMKSYSWEYASTAITQMAKFHALGVALRDENPQEFERLTKDFRYNFTDNKEQFNTVLKMALDNGCKVLSGEYRERLEKYFGARESLEKNMSEMMKDDKFLTHGDFKLTNLMHRRRNGKLEMILVDYQTLRLGNPVGDLMYFIFSGSDEDFRRLHYQRLLDLYFTQLTLALKQLRVDTEKVYPREAFDADLAKMQPFGLFLGLITVVTVTMSEEDASTVEQDLRKVDVTPSKLAAERITGIVRDYIRWGVL